MNHHWCCGDQFYRKEKKKVDIIRAEKWEVTMEGKTITILYTAFL